MKRLRTIGCGLLLGVAGVAHGAQWQGELGLEFREFLASPRQSTQHDSNVSLSGQVEYHNAWDDDRQSLTIKPLFRVDQHDDERTHVDMREAVWIFSDNGLEVRAGIDKVFWGVTEVYHLVDIINQTDALENPDGEQKLGQPMIKLSHEHDGGAIDLFVMPYFRERQYPSIEGRPRTHPRVAAELSTYENRRRQSHPDFAVRWSQTLGDWDLGLGYFYGTGRDPMLSPGLDAAGQAVLIPRYVVINQASIDLQGVVGDWLWKLEGLHRKGQGKDFFALTGGFEYTFYGVASSASDLGILAEVMWDQRGDSSSSPFNHDVFSGLRWAANDVDGTELLTGIVTDWSNGSRFLNLEASRRFGNYWKLGLQMRFWSNVDNRDALFALRDDDYVELKLSRYF